MQNEVSILHQWALAPSSLPKARALESRAPPKRWKGSKLAKHTALFSDRYLINVVQQCLTNGHLEAEKHLIERCIMYATSEQPDGGTAQVDTFTDVYV